MAADRDIRLNILSSKLSLRARRTLDIFIHLVIMVFGIIFLSGSITMARLNWQIPSLTLSGITLGHLYLSSAFAGIAIIVITIIRIIRDLGTAIKNNRYPEA